MGILVDNGSRVIVQGMTGREGASHSRAMKDFGTQVVAGVTLSKSLDVDRPEDLAAAETFLTTEMK